MKSSPYSFGLLRLFFAILIMYFHSFILGGYGPEPIEEILNHQIDAGSLAVSGFFVISGFLVSKSLIDSKNWIQFVIKRTLRIMPGFWVSLVSIVLGFAPLIYYLEHSRSFSGFRLPWHYLTDNAFLLIRRHALDNMLLQNPYPEVINGSLWTLFFEAKAYLSLLVLGLMKLNTKKTVMTIIFIGLWLLIIFGVEITAASNKFVRLLIDPGFLYFLTYFMAGSCMFLYKESLVYSNIWAGFIGLSLFLGTWSGSLLQIMPVILPISLYFLAVKLPLKEFGQKTDLSYGIFLYAFPVQQCLSLIGWNRYPLAYYLGTVIITLNLAFLSWNLIEKPALSLKKHRFVTGEPVDRR